MYRFLFASFLLASPLSAGKHELAVASTIDQARRHFEKPHETLGEPLDGTNGLYMFKLYNQRFFGVHKDLQKELDFFGIRIRILEELQLPFRTQFLQVIGDSTRFSPEGTVAGKQFLEAFLDGDDSVILWGFTGKELLDEATDVNELVNLWLKENPERFDRAIANVVDFHTVKAITDWQNSIPCENKNFWLVYGHAEFGDDIHSSDMLTDRCLVLEGGIQTFRQLVNMIDRGIYIRGIYNLRGNDNPEYYDPQTGKYFECFSASEFFALLMEKIAASSQPLSAADVEAFKNDYLNTHLLIRSNVTSGNPDAVARKIRLFEAGWKLFMENELWNRLDHCLFTKR